MNWQSVFRPSSLIRRISSESLKLQRLASSMGRPRPTKLIGDFVVLFADAVTATSAHPFDWIARNGEHCIFNLLLLLAPKVIAHQDAANICLDLT